MRIPSEEAWLDRAQLYEDIVRDCLSTQEDRRASYGVYRMYWMWGTGPEATPNTVYNYIYPLIDQLTAFVFASETTRFSAEFPATVSKIEHSKGPTVARAVQDEWLRSGGDMTFDSAVIMGHVYGCSIVKLRPKITRGNCTIESYNVDPGDFGVLREDIRQLERQEAFVQEYEITKSQLVNELKAAQLAGAFKDDQIERIERQVNAYQKETRTSTAAGLERIITSASQPSVQGNLDFSLNVLDKYRTRVSQPTVTMRELYIWDDSLNDYRVVTIAAPNLIIWDREIERTWVPHEVPFIAVTPTPLAGSFWGISEVERLVALQEMLNVRCGQIQHLLNLHANQPKSFSGFPGITDEMAFALDSPGGYVQTDTPTAKVDNMAPSLPEDLFREANRIIEMMEETAGISNVMQGKGEQGVRSTGHASQLLRVGASRVKKRAVRIEEYLESMGTKTYEGLRRYSKQKLAEDTEGGKTFTMAMVPEEVVIKVDGHSNSPIFVEDERQVAFDAFKVGAIDKAELLELLNMPMRQFMQWKLEYVLGPKQAAEAQALAAAQAAKHPGKVAPIRR